MKTILVLVCILAAVSAQGVIPTSLQGSYAGTLSFQNQLFKGFLFADVNNTIPDMTKPLYTGCCPEVYTEQAALVVTSNTANFSSPGVAGSCGHSLPGFIEFTSVTRVGTTQCFQGMMSLNGIVKNIPAFFQLNTDYSVKLDVFAAITDINAPPGTPKFNACPYADWTGATTMAGLPCTVLPSPVPLVTTNGTVNNALGKQAISGLFVKRSGGSASNLAPSLVVALLMLLAIVKLA
jgi:hypothetical protein